MLATLLLPGFAGAATLEVVVTNVRNAKGHVRVAACTQRTFTKEFCEHNGEAKAVAGETVVRLEVPPGTWAVQAYLDENDNEKVDQNLLGLPDRGHRLQQRCTHPARAALLR